MNIDYNRTMEEIQKLKKEKNAVILAHYYAPDEAQDAADYIGDSFYLAKVAKETDADIIVFCGVKFMGESAKILNPNKKVLMPDTMADCPMAHMVTKEKIADMRKRYDDLAVVAYINSTADIKCVSDVCVTSSNALKIVRKLPNKNIFFVPDGNLGSYVRSQVPEKNVILNDGYCHVHHKMTAKRALMLKNEHPDALILSHPECRKEVLDISDYIGSTLGIINFAGESDKKEFIICTEKGVGYTLRKNNPDKVFYFDEEKFCVNMKMNTLDKVLNVLKTEENEVVIEDGVREKALSALDRMLELAK
ncbi:MAG: quinolinate synthase NadA [Firmicutes bacterium]|nr:quinolinate synthase NadA [Bacillota bacterium]